NDGLKGYKPDIQERKLDTLDSRYKIDLNQPLPELNTRSARAYAATDSANRNHSLFALVCSPNTLQRYAAIGPMKNMNHPNLLQLIAAGVVQLSQPEESRFVLMYVRPEGRKLPEVISTIPAAGREYFITRQIIAPIASAIYRLSEFNISHGMINLDNIF